MSISLLKQLERGEFTVAFFLTYTLNLGFFESLVLPRLRRAGVTRSGIIADQKGYQDSLDDPLQPSECGRAYLVAPARLPGGGIQHAKLLWLQGRTHIEAYLGSHNLTMAGYNDQLELTAHLSSREPGHTGALRDIHAAVSRVVPETLHWVWRHTSPPVPSDEPPAATFLTSLDRPLVDQLAPIVNSAPSLRVVTPFLDSGAFERLIERFGVRRTILDVPNEGADTPLAAANGVGRTLRHLTAPRRLHAKALEFGGVGTSHLAIGSANCTRAALERSVGEGGNLEFLLLLERATLPADGPEFSRVEDPASFPYTGRSWDEGRGPSSPVQIHSAEYRDGRLEVSWSTHGAAPSEMLLRSGGEEAPCSGGHGSIELSTPPSTATLRAVCGGEAYETRAWVAVPEALDAEAARPALRRLEEHLVSDNPLQQADGISALLIMMLRDVAQPDSEDDSVLAAFSTRTRVASAGTLRPILDEISRPSPDPERIRGAVRQLLASTTADPLAILRALIARLAAGPTLAMQGNEDDSSEYDRVHRLARQRLGESLARHFELLTASDRDWAASSELRIAACLEGSFAATALIWHHELATDINNQLRTRLVEGYIALLNRLAAAPNVRPVLSMARVAGPCMLSLGAMAQAARADNFLTDQLRRLGRELLRSGPREVLAMWRGACAPQAEILLAGGRGIDYSSRWEAPALRLFGFAPSHVSARQNQQWGLLIELQEADLGRSPQRDALFEATKVKYRDTPEWSRYVAARERSRLPVIVRVPSPRCDRCFITLPSRKVRQFELGNPVLCDCGRILLSQG